MSYKKIFERKQSWCFPYSCRGRRLARFTVASVNSNVNHEGTLDLLSLKGLGKSRRRLYWTSGTWLFRSVVALPNWSQKVIDYPGLEAQWKRKGKDTLHWSKGLQIELTTLLVLDLGTTSEWRKTTCLVVLISWTNQNLCPFDLSLAEPECYKG